MDDEGLSTPDDLKGLYKFGGVAFILSGILFLSRDLLDLMAGPLAVLFGPNPRE